ncbi:ABC transporter ATP-binding protein [Sulfidibacter corallicola]|uniref:ABC transporter ATP-binding protein n=1 Tax=Sulfidibacter corallicola TaxID=2818388 RepID=A0A8A4TN15_SULCO|nr:ATP-binding cassette domain-containing protein [Sulfidibacter corallicola]QTD50940.1 ABC transporter ATP-binding protein [Sulfidibacter corallicola]
MVDVERDQLPPDAETVAVPAFRRHSGSGRKVLDTEPFVFRAGETVAITGPSGSGKSLFLKCLFGWAGGTEPEAAFAPSSGACLLIQDPAGGLTPALTIGAHFREVMPGRGTAARALELLGELGLTGEDLLQRFPASFSGGERQRIMLALVLARQPRWLFCDEPAASLDAESERRLFALLRSRLLSKGCTLVFVTHQLDLIRAYADRVLVFHRGRHLFEGASVDFFESARHPYHRALLAAANRLGGMVPVPNWEDRAMIARDAAPRMEAAETPERDPAVPLASDDAGTAEVASDAGSESGGEVDDLVLRGRGLGLAYGSRWLFRDLDLDFHPGQWTWLMGPSGCGKTSLARMLAGLPVRGTCHGTLSLSHQAISFDWRRRAEAQLRAVQLLVQHGDAAFNPAVPVAQQLAWAFDSQTKPAVPEWTCTALLARLGLADLDLAQPPSAFSMGERQRLQLCRAFAMRPRLLIGDELLAALDIEARFELLALLTEYQQAFQAAVLLITHDRELCAAHPGRVLQF